MHKSKLLIVGSFPSSDKKIYGGIAKSCKILLESETFLKYEIDTIDSSQTNPAPIIIIRIISAFKRIVNLFYKLTFTKPKLIIIFCSDGASAVEKGLMILISKLYNIPSLIFPRAGNLINQVNNSKLFLNIIKFMFKRADIFLCQGNSWANFAEKKLRLDNEKIKIIDNWTATDDLIQIGEKREINSNKGTIKILFVGWLEKEKGVEELLISLNNLNKTNINFKMIFIGNGSMMNYCRLFIHKNNLSELVELKGWLNPEEIINYYTTSDLFVLPSWQEGMPNSIIEALSCGLPIITTSVGVIPDYLTNNTNALIVKPKSIKDLEIAIQRAISDIYLRKKLSKNGFLVAKSLFLSKTSLEKFSILINNTIN